MHEAVRLMKMQLYCRCCQGHCCGTSATCRSTDYSNVCLLGCKIYSSASQRQYSGGKTPSWHTAGTCGPCCCCCQARTSSLQSLPTYPHAVLKKSTTTRVMSPASARACCMSSGVKTSVTHSTGQGTSSSPPSMLLTDTCGCHCKRIETVQKRPEQVQQTCSRNALSQGGAGVMLCPLLHSLPSRSSAVQYTAAASTVPCIL